MASHGNSGSKKRGQQSLRSKLRSKELRYSISIRTKTPVKSRGLVTRDKEGTCLIVKKQGEGRFILPEQNDLVVGPELDSLYK